MTPYDAPVAEFFGRHRLTGDKSLESWPANVWSAFWAGEPAGRSGLAALLERAFQETRDESVRRALEAYRAPLPCAPCGGSRLRAEALAVRLGGRSIAELTSLALSDLSSFFQSLRIEPAFDEVGSPLVAEILTRVRVPAGGRARIPVAGPRIRHAFRRRASAGAIGRPAWVRLEGVCTILDEPTAGLHTRDTERLIASIRHLLSQGNSLLVVEHDASMIRAADWVVDLGPGAGPDGGTVVAVGTPEALRNSKTSITARYLERGLRLAGGPSPRLAASPGWIHIQGATLHNLKQVDAQIPLAAVTCVTGVSGSGKSTLINDVLARVVRRFLQRRRAGGAGGEGVVGLEAIDQLVEVDQSPIGRGPRSTPATATGVYNEIRRVFALTREAKIRGYAPVDSASTPRGAAVRRVGGSASVGCRCTFLPIFMSRAKSAAESGSTAKPSRFAGKDGRSATSWK